MNVIDKIYDGEATDGDVMRCLGWTVTAHAAWGWAMRKEGESLQSVPRVLSSADDAISLFDLRHINDAINAAMAINRPVAKRHWHPSANLASRLCIIALTMPDLRTDSRKPQN